MSLTGFVLITGTMAAGKSTVAQALAERLPRAAHVRGDAFRRFIVSGRAPIGSPTTADDEAQLALRYRLSALAGDQYVRAGFTAVVQDIIVGPWLPRYIALVRSRPLHVIVLDPSPEAIAAREAARPKTGYKDGWTVADLHRDFVETTPRIGLWLDTSNQQPAETVDAILARAAEAIVPG